MPNSLKSHIETLREWRGGENVQTETFNSAIDAAIDALSRAPIAEGGAVDVLSQIRRVIGNGDTAHLAMDASATVGLGQFIDAAIESLSRQGGENSIVVTDCVFKSIPGLAQTAHGLESEMLTIKEVNGVVTVRLHGLTIDGATRASEAGDSDAIDAAKFRIMRDSWRGSMNLSKGYLQWFLPRKGGGFMSLDEHLDSLIAAAPAPGGEL